MASDSASSKVVQMNDNKLFDEPATDDSSKNAPAKAHKTPSANGVDAAMANGCSTANNNGKGKNKNQNKKQNKKPSPTKKTENNPKSKSTSNAKSNPKTTKMDIDSEKEKKENPGKPEKTSSDYYFDSYSHFGIHEEMLKDKVRTGTYHKAIVKNPHLFKNKVVLDIGCGTGILCLFAAKTGAKKVYGIEMAGIANNARQIVKENGYSDVIEIIKGKVEDVSLPDGVKADVIISEWMGYFLLYESMLNTVLVARDRWLKPNGILMPDKARLFIAAIEDGDYMNEKINFWDNVYGFKMSCLKAEAMKEPLVDVVHAQSVVSESQQILTIDLNAVKTAELDFASNFTLKFKVDDYCHAFVAYFDVLFSRCHTRVGFSTAPFSDYTHWKQTVFYLDTPLMVIKGTKLHGRITVRANKKNPRDLDIDLSSNYSNRKIGSIKQTRKYFMR